MVSLSYTGLNARFGSCRSATYWTNGKSINSFLDYQNQSGNILLMTLFQPEINCLYADKGKNIAFVQE